MKTWMGVVGIYGALAVTFFEEQVVSIFLYIYILVQLWDSSFYITTT